jgi:integrase/recombinase XerD
MKPSNEAQFKHDYKKLIQHLKLKGHQPKTIDGYSRGIRRIGDYFHHQIHDLTDDQLTDYFDNLLTTHSWSAVKQDLYGLKFYYRHVLDKLWTQHALIKPPRATRIPDIVTVEEATALFAATNVISYRTFYFTLYSLGLRLGEGLALQIGDIDAARQRVHIRDAKGNKTGLFPCQTLHSTCCVVFGPCTRTPCCSFPIAREA